MCWWKIPPKKTIYIVGLCKADNYEGMTGLVKCCAITQQREGMMSNKRLGDVWNSKNVASSIACMTQTWQIMSSETGANESTTSGSKHSYEPWIGDILDKDLQITSILCTCSLAFENPPRKISAGRWPWSLRFEIAIGCHRFPKTNCPTNPTTSVNSAKEDFESQFEVIDSVALGCFDLMPGLARNTSTYLHIASCGFCRHSPLVFRLINCWL